MPVILTCKLNVLDLFLVGEAANNYSLKLFVKVYDIYSAVTIQETTVVVRPIPIDASAVNKFAGAVDSDIESGDLAKGAGMMVLSFKCFSDYFDYFRFSVF